MHLQNGHKTKWEPYVDAVKDATARATLKLQLLRREHRSLLSIVDTAAVARWNDETIPVLRVLHVFLESLQVQENTRADDRRWLFDRQPRVILNDDFNVCCHTTEDCRRWMTEKTFVEVWYFVTSETEVELCFSLVESRWVVVTNVVDSTRSNLVTRETGALSRLFRDRGANISPTWKPCRLVFSRSKVKVFS